MRILPFLVKFLMNVQFIKVCSDAQMSASPGMLGHMKIEQIDKFL